MNEGSVVCGDERQTGRPLEGNTFTGTKLQCLHPVPPLSRYPRMCTHENSETKPAQPGPKVVAQNSGRTCADRVLLVLQKA
jgi:hypothetical protein